MKNLSLAFALASMLIAPAAMADITAKDVKEVLTRHHGEVRACYEKFAKKQRTAKGRVSLDIDLKRSGEVAKVSIQSPGVKGKPFYQCVEDKVSAWRFPENSGVTLTVPFRFQHTQPSS